MGVIRRWGLGWGSGDAVGGRFSKRQRAWECLGSKVGVWGVGSEALRPPIATTGNEPEEMTEAIPLSAIALESLVLCFAFRV